ncbi:hypothetical protein [Absidia glauca]|uniref:Uncharacterized protein n=1 Tax=Absidia glauca TaxID=4829 RepID=A0A163MJ22_ABSGL|nr:hypothetical protein [Absidia glauca]
MSNYYQPSPSSIASSQQQQQQQHQQLTLLEYINELVSKRVSTIQYLSRTHQGSTHWFNTILLTRDDLDDMYSNTKMMKRSCNFYTLGVSLGNLLHIINPIDFVKALAQLLTEFEHHTNDTSRQKMKNIFKKTNKSKDGSGHSDGSGEYTHLIVPHVPYELDYFEIFFTLCDILTEIYQRFILDMEGCQHAQVYFESAVKADGKFKKILSMITKELDALARNAIKDELKLIDPLSYSNKVTPIDFDAIE